MNYVLVAVLGSLMAGLQYQFWLGDYGVARLSQLNGTVEVQKQEIDKLRQRNGTLLAEVVDLQQGSAAVEERARSELGLIKPGEVFFQVVESAPRASAKSALQR
jgi:cell division protein FtsB